MSYGIHRGGYTGSYFTGSATGVPPPAHVHSQSHSSAMSTPNHPSHSRSGSTGSGLPMPYMTHSHSGTGFGHHFSPQHSASAMNTPQKRSWLSETTALPYDPNRSPPQRRGNYSQHNIPRDASYHSNIHSEGSGGRYPGEGEGKGRRESEREKEGERGRGKRWERESYDESMSDH